MQLAKHKNSLETNGTFESQSFGIGDASVVIEILRNRLYQHKVRTLVQEYVCNARDAHREVGNNAPIEVTVPNRLNPVFKVRDYGPGISPERMAAVFVMYGASTKRGNNHQTGGFGIGAKSAWCYTDSFTIVTHIDGVRRTYIAHTGVDNNGRLDFISEDSTTEKNGTEIQIAVKQEDLNEFKDSIFRATYFWETSPILKGLVDVSFERNVRLQVENLDLYYGFPSFISPEYSRSLILSIDGVPYETDKLINKIDTLYNLRSMIKNDGVIHVKTGEVEVSASREQIVDTPANIKFLSELGAQLIEALKKRIADEYSKVNTFSDFIKLHEIFGGIIQGQHLTSKFENYKIEYDYIYGLPDNKQILKTIHRNTRRNKVEETDHISLQYYGRIYYTKGESKIVINRRLKTLLTTTPNGIVLFKQVGDDSTPFLKTIKDLGAIDLSTIEQTKEPVALRIKKQVTEICAHVPKSRERQTYYINLLNNTDKYLYSVMEESCWSMNVYLLEELNRYLKDYKVIGIAPRSVKLIENNPNFMEIGTFLGSFKPTADDLICVKKSLSKNIDCMESFKKAEGLKCPFLDKMSKEYTQMYPRESAPQILVDLLKDCDTVKEFLDDDKKLSNELRERYPLLHEMHNRYMSGGSVKEWVIYANAKQSACEHGEQTKGENK